ncbi:MAG TPA: beta-ketoacyl synthase N-terminal-like domain-containing protein [Trebonia sp.]
MGAALRLPGAADPASFHELVLAGRRMFRDVPQIAAPRDAVHPYGTAPAPPAYLLRAALLDGTVSQTEPALEETVAMATRSRVTVAAHAKATVSPDRAASGIGGQARSVPGGTRRHMLAAETAAAALADVPSDGRPTRPGRTGAIIAELPEPGEPYVTGWVTRWLGLTPQDGAPPHSCSLRAVATACALLSADQFDLVLAGGVSMGIDPAWLAYRIQSGAFADDDVRIYDASPTGTLPGEGCGVVALMRATDARAAGLPVYAEIAGWQAANDITAPSAAISDAYLRAGVDPADVQYVEGHGAATAVDDLAELTALLDVLAPWQYGTGCALGSVAANIGDTGGAAGVAALLKTALAMTAGIIPPTTGCVEPHQLLRAGAAPFRLPSSPEPWPEAVTRLAAVNSLGKSGPTGGARSGPVHIVLRRDLESGPLTGPRRRVGRVSEIFTRGSVSEIFTRGSVSEIFARGSGAVHSWGAHARPLIVPPRPRNPPDSTGPLVAAPDADSPQHGDQPHPDQPPARDAGIPEQAAGADVNENGPNADSAIEDGATRETPTGGFAIRDRLTADTLTGDWVIAVRGTGREDLAVTLDTIAMAAARLPGTSLREFALEMAATPAAADLRARAAIVARNPVQLAERARKAAATLRERTLGTSSAGTGAYVSDGASGRIALLFPGLVSTGVEHSAVLSASMATLGVTERLGVEPQLAVGYSFGEIAGLAWAGVLTFGEAARLAAHRAEIIRATPGRAAMARVHASPSVVAGLCSGTGLTVAAYEGPVQHVVAGPAPDIRVLPQRAARQGVDAEVLSITHGLHSLAMLASAAPMRAVIDGLWFSQPRRRLISTVTGLDITDSADPSELITGQLARPALLAGALALACADADLIVLTAHDPALARVAGDRDRVPVLQAPLEQRPGTVVPSALAAFFAAGAIDSVLPFLPGGSAVAVQAGGAGGGGIIRSGSSEAEGTADRRPAADPVQPAADQPAADQPAAERDPADRDPSAGDLDAAEDPREDDTNHDPAEDPRADAGEPEAAVSPRADTSEPDAAEGPGEDDRDPDPAESPRADGGEADAAESPRADAGESEAAESPRADAKEPDAPEAPREHDRDPDAAENPGEDGEDPDPAESPRADAGEPDADQSSRADASEPDAAKGPVADTGDADAAESPRSDGGEADAAEGHGEDGGGPDPAEDPREDGGGPNAAESPRTDGGEADAAEGPPRRRQAPRRSRKPPRRRQGA